LPFKNLKLDSGACPGLDPSFAGVTEIGKAWFLVVIPAGAGIQDDEKTEFTSGLGARSGKFALLDFTLHFSNSPGDSGGAHP
jgi:hypothetical protein